MLTAVPATAVGLAVKVSVLTDVAFPAQGREANAVNVKVTLPFVLSAALGV